MIAVARLRVGARATRLAGAAILVAVAACGPGDRDASSEGEAPEPREPRRAEVTLTLPVAGEGEPPVGGWVSGVAMDMDGRIWAAEAQGRRIRGWDSAGTELAALDEAAGVPLRTPCCLTVGPDGRLWVRDGGAGQYVGLRLPGAEAGATDPDPRAVPMPPADLSRWTSLAFRGDSLVDVVVQTEAGAPRHLLLGLTDVGAAAPVGESVGGWDPPGSRFEPIVGPAPESLGARALSRELPGGEATFWYWPADGPRWVVALGPGGRWATVRTDSFRIVFHPPEGDAVVVEGATPGGRDVASPGPGAPGPDALPRFRGIFFDGAGRLWLEHTVGPGEPRTADVFAETGRWVERRSWPADVELGLAGWLGGDVAVGVGTDPSGAQRLVRLRW